jgi:hypothetical protein
VRQGFHPLGFVVVVEETFLGSSELRRSAMRKSRKYQVTKRAEQASSSEEWAMKPDRGISKTVRHRQEYENKLCSSIWICSGGVAEREDITPWKGMKGRHGWS